ncbi:MAG: hypothetical protein ACI9UA_001072 [Pseudoalteromonas tetraodonis]|jgi:hypothetical protein
MVKRSDLPSRLLAGAVAEILWFHGESGTLRTVDGSSTGRLIGGICPA